MLFLHRRYFAVVWATMLCASSAAPPAHAATTITYSYDELDRLEAVVRSDGPSLNYQYDVVGNITVRTSTNPDTDGDLLKDIVEITFGTHPGLADSDMDGLSDYMEVCYDGDCTTYTPFPSGTDLDANAKDTDGDGVNDDVEVEAGTNPLDPASFPIVADGDLNEDGLVTTADMMIGLQILNGSLVPDPDLLAKGDVAPLVNGVPQPNGVFNVGDLLLILRKAMGQISF